MHTSHSKISRPWRVKSLGFVCSPSFFSLPAACRLFSRDFHARSRFALSTIPEEKWGTTRSLPFAMSFEFLLRRWRMFAKYAIFVKTATLKGDHICLLPLTYMACRFSQFSLNMPFSSKPPLSKGTTFAISLWLISKACRFSQFSQNMPFSSKSPLSKGTTLPSHLTYS